MNALWLRVEAVGCLSELPIEKSPFPWKKFPSIGVDGRGCCRKKYFGVEIILVWKEQLLYRRNNCCTEEIIVVRKEIVVVRQK